MFSHRVSRSGNRRLKRAITWRPPHNRRRAVIRFGTRATGTVDQAETSAFGHEERVGVMVHGATVSRMAAEPPASQTTKIFGPAPTAPCRRCPSAIRAS